MKSPALRGILVKARQKDREKRFQTAGELEQALAKLSPQAAGPFLPQGDEPVPGRCPKCGHQHVSHEKVFDRKFCESCGNLLLEPCLKCKRDNGVWSKFCGKCGADLVGTLQAAATELQAKREQVASLRKLARFVEAIQCLVDMTVVDHPRLLEYAQWANETLPQVRTEFEEAKREHIISLCKVARYNEAIQCLVDMTRVDHPRLLEYAKWANETLPQVRTEFEEAKRGRDCAIEEARSLMRAGDFAGAIPVLEAIAQPLQTGESTALVKQSQAAVAEIGVLRGEIRSRLASKQLEGLKAKVLLLIDLQPNDPQLPKLLQQLMDWESRQQQEREARELRERQEQEARERRQQQQLWEAAAACYGIDGYRRYLEAYPQGTYVAQARQALAPLLREKLLANMNDRDLRGVPRQSHAGTGEGGRSHGPPRESDRLRHRWRNRWSGRGSFYRRCRGLAGAILAGLVAGIAVAIYLDR